MLSHEEIVLRHKNLLTGRAQAKEKCEHHEQEAAQLRTFIAKLDGAIEMTAELVNISVADELKKAQAALPGPGDAATEDAPVNGEQAAN